MRYARAALAITGVAGAILATTAAATATPAPAAHPSCPAEMAAIRVLPEQRVPAAWKNNDAIAFAALYTRDATLVVPGPGGVYLNGRDQIRTYMEANFAGPARGSTVTAKVVSARCVTRHVAVLVTTGGIVLPGETEPPAERIGVQTWTIINQHGRWLATAYQNARGVDLNPPDSRSAMS
jgi:uncharacterized protein (TIGR02246 family)